MVARFLLVLLLCFLFEIKDEGTNERHNDEEEIGDEEENASTKKNVPFFPEFWKPSVTEVVVAKVDDNSTIVPNTAATTKSNR
mmetsp:Transcript_1876/g.2117  ORF Transcript_1876/g.2117 Transcript_1876/m.2117 type:complete len:83 (+) Transcript_1876:1560-1808(+)